ncbi:MAG: hypothetical protein K1X79_00360 [Oligoflexia bacterium]|nr:hypothetical protein [Oligoflexia bacterium]
MWSSDVEVPLDFVAGIYNRIAKIKWLVVATPILTFSVLIDAHADYSDQLCPAKTLELGFQAEAYGWSFCLPSFWIDSDREDFCDALYYGGVIAKEAQEDALSQLTQALSTLAVSAEDHVQNCDVGCKDANPENPVSSTLVENLMSASPPECVRNDGTVAINNLSRHFQQGFFELRCRGGFGFTWERCMKKLSDWLEAPDHLGTVLCIAQASGTQTNSYTRQCQNLTITPPSF